MASSKLKMLKNIRVQRAAEESKKTEAVERARLVIAYILQAYNMNASYEKIKGIPVQTFIDMSLNHYNASPSCILGNNEKNRLLIHWITQCLHIWYCRLLIAEAEKAAKALEVAAVKSPVARASLIETKKLIAEAIQSIESIERGQVTSDENGGYISVDSAEPVSPVEKKMQSENNGLSQADQKEVNGNQILSLSKNEEFNFPNFMFSRIANGDSDEELTSPSWNNYSLSTLNFESLIKKSDSSKQLNQLETNGIIKHEKNPLPNGTKVHLKDDDIPSKAVAVTKKWVSGRLVEVTEEAS